MARELLSVSSISINDLNDAVVSGTAPSNPDEGMLWLNDKVLKQYTNGKWVTVTLDILKMDEVLKTTINSIKETLGNISADGKLSFIDRKVVSKNIGEIIGEMPSTSKSSKTVLPDYTTLDSKGVGTFSFLRSTALSVGITKDEHIYKEMELTYKNLASYLASTNPKMWDITDANEEKVITLSNTDDFNGYFLNYYLAEAEMSAEIDKRANELMLKITEGSKSGVVVKDLEGTELYTTEADLNGALDIVVEGGTENLAPVGEGRNLLIGTDMDIFVNSNNGSTYPISRTWVTDNEGSFWRIRRTKTTLNPSVISLYTGIGPDLLDPAVYEADNVIVSFKARANFARTWNVMQGSAVVPPAVYGNLGSIVIDTHWKTFYTVFPKIPKGATLRVNPQQPSSISGITDSFYLDIKEWHITAGKKEFPYSVAPERLTTPNLISANNFSLVSQMGKFKNISSREDNKEVTNAWVKHSTTAEVSNEPYTSERYPYLNLRKIGFKDISMLYRSGGETNSEGVRGGKYTYVMYLKPLVSGFTIINNGLEAIRGIRYRNGERGSYTGNLTLAKGDEYLIIYSFTHRLSYDFWQIQLSNHGTKETEFVMSNLMLFEGDVVSEIEATLPGVGTILNPDGVTGTPDWAKVSSSYVELPQPLRDAGNGVRDQLRRNDDGRWEIYRRVNEFEVQDALSVLAQEGTNIVRMSLYGYTGKNALGKNNATGYVTGLKSSHFTYSGEVISSSTPEWSIGTNGVSGAWAHNLMFKLPTQYGTLQAFKNFATAEAKKGNPIRVVYELREPFVEELSDEVQITLDKVFTYPHSNSIYTVFPDLDKAYNHPHPYLKANFLGGADGTRRRTESDLNDKANQEDVDSINDAIVTVNATTENLGDKLEDTVTELTSVGDTVSGIESKMTQTANGWDFRFSNFATTVSDLEKETTNGFSRINSYIRFEGGKIILGQEGSNTFLEIAPDRINFNNGGAVVAYITNQTMEITHGIFVQTATIAGMRIQRVPGSNNIGFTII